MNSAKKIVKLRAAAHPASRQLVEHSTQDDRLPDGEYDKELSVEAPRWCAVGNPSPRFVGRSEELAWLERTLSVSPLAYIWGLPNLGRACVCLEALHVHLPISIVRVCHLAPGTRVDLESSLVRLAGELRSAAIVAGAGPPPLGSHELVDWLVVAVDMLGIWMLVEDIDFEHDRLAQHLVDSILDRSRESKWLLTGSIRPDRGRLLLVSLRLEPMPYQDLLELARQCAPAGLMGSLEIAAQSAFGSPSRLLAGMAGVASPICRPDLGGVSAEAHISLRLLSELEGPLELSALSSVFKQLGANDGGRCISLGLIDKENDLCEIHGPYRELIRSSIEAPDLFDSGFVGSLLATQQPHALLHGARLLAEGGRVTQAVKVLRSSMSNLISVGEGERLWAVVVGIRARSADSLLIELAAVLGKPLHGRSVSAAGTDEFTGTAAFLHSGRQLSSQRKYDEAVGVLESALASGETEQDARLRRQLAVRLSMALYRSGRTTEAIRICERESRRARPRLDGLDVWLHFLKLTQLGDSETDLLDVLPIDALDDEYLEDGILIGGHVVSNLGEGGRLSAAIAIGEKIMLAKAVYIFDTADGRFLAAQLAVAYYSIGRLTEAVEILDRLKERQAHSVLPTVVDLQCVQLGMAVGHFFGIEEVLKAAVSQRATEAGRGIASIAYFQLAGLLICQGRAEQFDRIDSLETGEASYFQMEAGRVVVWHLAVVQGLRLGDDQWPTAIDIGRRSLAAQSLQIEYALVAAKACLLDQRQIDVACHLRAVESMLGETELRCWDPHFYTLAIETALIDGQYESAKYWISMLAQCSEDMASNRWRLCAKFFSVLSVPGSSQWYELVPILLEGTVAPVASRRAKAILGMNATLDALDKVLVRRILDSVDDAVFVVGNGGAAAPEGAIEPEQAVLWIDLIIGIAIGSDGSRIDFGGNGLFRRLLECLVANGGLATKESIFTSVWPGEVYHPLDHGPRLRQLVRRFRKWLQPLERNGVALQVLDDGYSIAAMIVARVH